MTSRLIKTKDRTSCQRAALLRPVGVVRAIGHLDRRGPAEAIRSRLKIPDPRVKAIGEITTRHLFDMVVDLNPRLAIGVVLTLPDQPLSSRPGRNNTHG